MRHLLLALMIALLPVRGWMGNAMAIDMAVNMAMQQALMTQSATEDATPASGSNAASQAAAAMPEDCPMGGQNQDGKSVEGEQAGDAAASCNCNSCELCLALASLTFPTMATAAFTAHAEPPTHGRRSAMLNASSASNLPFPDANARGASPEFRTTP